MTTVSRTRLALEDCGAFASIKTQPDVVKSMTFCSLIGICSGTTERKSPDKITVYRGLMGDFRVVPTDPDATMIESRQLFFPAEFNELVAPMLKNLGDAGDGSELHFVYEISAVRANNDAGYSVNFTPKIPAVIFSRLDGFIGEIGAIKNVTGKRVLVVEDKSKPAPPAKK